MSFDQLISGLLRDGYSVRFVATGDSMYPSIRSGDMLEVEPAAASDLRAGDVVLTRAPRGLTAHRIIKIDSACVVTRGDNALRSDGPLPISAIVGRVSPGANRTRSPLARKMLYLRTVARKVRGAFTKILDRARQQGAAP